MSEFSRFSIGKIQDLRKSVKTLKNTLARFLKDHPKDSEIHAALTDVLALEDDLDAATARPMTVLKTMPKPETRTKEFDWYDPNTKITWRVSITQEDRGPGAGGWTVIDSEFVQL